ncbi:MAG: GH3 auxin-responsive promoter family protein [Cytophagales bacterium]|nr:GH3 auxin-responsive promoter family protein [Cytophagales bacterium]
MKLFNSVLFWVLKKRIHQIELFLKYPVEVQQELLQKLLVQSKNTEWGKKYDYASITSIQTFQERVPISTYEDIFPYIERVLRGEQNILWGSKIKWFAKSSGTTNAKSKFIPVSQEALVDCHFKAGKDMLSLYAHNYENVNLFTGKSLSIAGTHQINPDNPSSSYGDISGVVIQNLPAWAKYARAPRLKTALMSEWESKIEQMAEETIKENITSLAGVPTWMLVLIQKVLDKTKADNILEVWPNLELYGHGAVSFEPYRELFKELLPKPEMNYLELYNASEGFIGIQDRPNTGEMLLMLDLGIFYEFIPMEHFGEENSSALTLDQVELGKNYALVISTNAGLWRYLIGDTIQFTTLYPFRFRITGRTKHFINAFGEELIVDNAEKAISVACLYTEAKISNYTAGPLYFEGNQNGGHEWIIEFEKQPTDFDKFCHILDNKLKEINSDYEAKRYQDIALRFPKIHNVPQGTFYNWMKKRGKLGAQHKVPRLANNRTHLEEILKIV